MKDLVIKRLIRRSGKNGTGVRIIYFRFQLVWDGVRYPYFESSSKIKVDDSKKWDRKACLYKGSSFEVKELNKDIIDKQDAIKEFWRNYQITSTSFNYYELKGAINAQLGGKYAVKYIKENKVYIPDLFDRHVKAGKPEGGDYSSKRIGRYMRIKKQVKNYCTVKYNTDKVTLDTLDDSFYYGFRQYLHQNLDLKQTTLGGYMKVFTAAVNSEWKREKYNSKNPLIGCKTSLGKSTRVGLSLDELNKIKNLPDELLDDNTATARDIFLFGCYTGISYCDLAALTSDYIKMLEGKEYLVKDREKNINNSKSNFFSVPITDDVRALLDKFSKHPKIAGTNKLIPVPNNSDYNKQLKLIRAKANITKPLSSHIARHTMAFLFIEAGGSLEVLMRLLGHSRISQTQEYGKVSPSRISREMNDALEYISNKSTDKNKVLKNDRK